MLKNQVTVKFTDGDAYTTDSKYVMLDEDGLEIIYPSAKAYYFRHRIKCVVWHDQGSNE